MIQGITYTTSTEEGHLCAILELQRQNLERNISDEELIKEGYVTAEHDFDLLSKMNDPYPHVIALVNNQLVGYALMMTRSFSRHIPVLIEMFDRIDQQTFKEDRLRYTNYVVMGQICISKDYRGKGIFYGLYSHMAKIYHRNFNYLITMVANRNQRSLHAHYKAGFVPLHQYESHGEEWNIILSDWSLA